MRGIIVHCIADGTIVVHEMQIDSMAMTPQFGIVCRPTPCASAAAPASTGVISRESWFRATSDLERPGRGGRLHAPVGRPGDETAPAETSRAA
jgi:hypothetical protein